MDSLAVKVAATYLTKQAEEAFLLDENGVQLFLGAPGGGQPDLPSWLPSEVSQEFMSRWSKGYDEAMVERGYEVGDDPLGISETDYGEASGFAILTDRPEMASEPEATREVGIVYWDTEPITFEIDGKTYFIVGGIGGV